MGTILFCGFFIAAYGVFIAGISSLMDMYNDDNLRDFIIKYHDLYN